MFYAKNIYGNKICARCGNMSDMLTKDHFIPKSCRLPVNEEGNLVAICENCNKEKGCSIVLPSWYEMLSADQQNKLLRYMRYARSYILDVCEDEEILQVVRDL